MVLSTGPISASVVVIGVPLSSAAIEADDRRAVLAVRGRDRFLEPPYISRG